LALRGEQQIIYRELPASDSSSPSPAPPHLRPSLSATITIGAISISTATAFIGARGFCHVVVDGQYQ